MRKVHIVATHQAATTPQLYSSCMGKATLWLACRHFVGSPTGKILGKLDTSKSKLRMEIGCLFAGV